MNQPAPDVALVPLVSVESMMRLVLEVGIETALVKLVACMEDDLRRRCQFDKTWRVASHSRDGVIELMATSERNE